VGRRFPHGRARFAPSKSAKLRRSSRNPERGAHATAVIVRLERELTAELLDGLPADRQT
jgi:hypothetical protein